MREQSIRLVAIHRNLILKKLDLISHLFITGLGDAWGAAPLCNNPRETCIKELGSHLLQVTKTKIHVIFHTLFQVSLSFKKKKNEGEEKKKKVP